jgi:hypothetical protein
MDDTKQPPKIFANHVIRQMVDHMLGDGIILEPKDYLIVRTAFRSLGGEWDQVGEGALDHLEKLKNVITQWGQMAKPKKEGDQVI